MVSRIWFKMKNLCMGILNWNIERCSKVNDVNIVNLTTGWTVQMKYLSAAHDCGNWIIDSGWWGRLMLSRWPALLPSRDQRMEVRYSVQRHQAIQGPSQYSDACDKHTNSHWEDKTTWPCDQFLCRQCGFLYRPEAEYLNWFQKVIMLWTLSRKTSFLSVFS